MLVYAFLKKGARGVEVGSAPADEGLQLQSNKINLIYLPTFVEAKTLHVVVVVALGASNNGSNSGEQ